MLWIIMVTSICNLKCRYCGGSIEGMPPLPTYDFDELRKFISKDKEAIIALYGGEPLLEIELVKKMLTLPAKKFVIQTNGFFIEKLGSHIHKFDTILLSIDGRRDITDYYRCNGCYDRVISALNFLRRMNYSGDIIARMAVSFKTDIYRDVMHLLNHFPYVHWQLDVVWSALWGLKEFMEWSKGYIKGIRRLAEKWGEEMKRGKLLGIVPFLGIASRILYGGDGLPCQAGEKAFAISTDGKIMACPIAYDFEWNILGDFKGFKKLRAFEECKSCDVYEICGGRCLFAYKERLWGEKGFREICRVTKLTINEVKKHIKTFEKFGIRYPPYNNTTEIIP